MKKKIITAPHLSLRQKSTAIEEVDQKLVNLVDSLGETLVAKRNPSGVGLAAPQINVGQRLFATNLHPDENEKQPAKLTVYINPVITKHSSHMSLGPDSEQPTLEGCLSIPGLYGPVPRFEWIRLEFQTLKNGRLVDHQQRFEWFDARVIQHELDHLDGILFTDYSLQYDLPVYQEDNKTKNLVEIDPTILEVF